MDDTTRKTAQDLLDEKKALMERIVIQMADDEKAGILRAETLDRFQKAKDCWGQAMHRLASSETKDQQEVFYFLGRISWNLGEFVAMSQQDKSKKQQ